MLLKNRTRQDPIIERTGVRVLLGSPLELDFESLKWKIVALERGKYIESRPSNRNSEPSLAQVLKVLFCQFVRPKNVKGCSANHLADAELAHWSHFYRQIC